jgi:hypothetical protein
MPALSVCHDLKVLGIIGCDLIGNIGNAKKTTTTFYSL